MPRTDMLGQGQFGALDIQARMCELESFERSLGWVYAKLSDLEERGVIVSQAVPGGTARGGKPKLIWSLTELGETVVAKGWKESGVAHVE